MLEGDEDRAHLLRQRFKSADMGELQVTLVTPEFEKWLSEETLEWDGSESEALGIKGLGGKKVRQVVSVTLAEKLKKRRQRAADRPLAD